MRVCVLGAGYVGLVTGACLSDFGNSVTVFDIDSAKIEKLNNGTIPIYEPGLDIFIKRNADQQRLVFTDDIEAAVSAAEIIFIAVGTPEGQDGSADISCVLEAARSIGQHLDDYKVVVIKSTVPLGTFKRVNGIICEAADGTPRAAGLASFDIVSNPEFLREGKGIYDFNHPDRVVIGASSDKAVSIMKGLYKPLHMLEVPFIITNNETAELIKYASNAFLAMKITFINEIANLCDKTGANIMQASRAIGRDGRIGSKFLHAGPGYGGSCFPKDTKALLTTARDHGVDLSIIEQVVLSNERQKEKAATTVEKHFGTLKGKTVCVLGLTFKPETDDVRESPSITIISELIKRGALIHASCPQGMDNAKRALANAADNIRYFDDLYEAAAGADALVIVTEWTLYRSLDFDRLSTIMSDRVLFDLRNIYYPDYVRSFDFVYYGTGQ